MQLHRNLSLNGIFAKYSNNARETPLFRDRNTLDVRSLSPIFFFFFLVFLSSFSFPSFPRCAISWQDAFVTSTTLPLHHHTHSDPFSSRLYFNSTMTCLSCRFTLFTSLLLARFSSSSSSSSFTFSSDLQLLYYYIVSRNRSRLPLLFPKFSADYHVARSLARTRLLIFTLSHGSFHLSPFRSHSCVFLPLILAPVVSPSPFVFPTLHYYTPTLIS